MFNFWLLTTYDHDDRHLILVLGLVPARKNSIELLPRTATWLTYWTATVYGNLQYQVAVRDNSSILIFLVGTSPSTNIRCRSYTVLLLKVLFYMFYRHDRFYHICILNCQGLPHGVHQTSVGKPPTKTFYIHVSQASNSGNKALAYYFFPTTLV